MATEGSTKDPCDAPFLYGDRGGGHTNLHMIKLHRNTYVHTAMNTCKTGEI